MAKGRESDMPPPELWEGFFEPDAREGGTALAELTGAAQISLALGNEVGALS